MTITMDHPSGYPGNEVSYRRFDDDASPLTEADIPVRPENRTKTDRAFSFIMGGCIVIAILFLLITFVIVIKHEPNRQSFNEAVMNEGGISNQEEFQDFSFKKFAWKLTLTSFISLGLTIIMAVLYRHATSFVVWGVLIISWAYFFIVTVALWWLNVDNIILKIIFTIVTVVLLCVLVFMKDKIRLVTMLFKEATKATFRMQAVFSVPAVTLLLLVIVWSIYIPATLYINFAGISSGSADSEYISGDFRITAVIFNTIITIWISEFLVSIQYMIVSGAVTKWYFTRNKELLGDPVYTSCYNTIKYHIGTAALGSLIITIVAVLRAILRALSQHSRFRVLVNCCMARIEEFIRFFTKNAFIVTAMHGTPFIQSGKRAVKLLTLNICNTITINSLGDFVLTMSSVLIVGLSVLFAYFILGVEKSENIYGCIFFVVVIALICCCTVLGTFETSFSTLFLCVCQDFLINNGIEKPYAMTRDLMEFLEDSKKTFAEKIEKKNLPKI
ncbi:choline transporter-like protein 1 isoform X2 [Anoplophora glabripennis]|uniref:choline transporter-like protein 1 isoform X2 n=1 Tax=Anoplophora glabripennis TaxID=217634 RepID=UPI0008755939|nr:choline transporter-like protein 1 isoform X2 [Anoplophora glabripennis]